MRRLALLALLLAACSGGINHGVILSKTDTPPRDWTYLMPQYITHCDYAGKYPVCYSQLAYFLPVPMHDAERWSVLVQGADRGTDNWNVSEDWYNAHEVGDTVDRP